MKINIGKIPKEGLRIEEDCAADNLELNTDWVHFNGPIKIELDLRREEKDIFISGKIEGELEMSCDRCLIEYCREFSKDIFMQIPVANKSVLDITDNIREEVILEFPVKRLCKKECKGLCPKCGKNFNEGKCGCNNKG